MAVIAAVKKFRVYILGSTVEIRTDHSAVRQVLNKPDATGRYARWGCILSEFDFILRYRPGVQHGNADGLSKAKLLVQDLEVGIDDEVKGYGFRAEIQRDPWYNDVISYLTTGNAPGKTKRDRMRVRRLACRFLLRDGELYYHDLDGEVKMCISQQEAPHVLREFHDSAFGGHWGRDVTLGNLRCNFYWPTMHRDVILHVCTCEACQKWETPPGAALRKFPTYTIEPFDLIYLDWMVYMPVTPSGNTSILTCTDAMTK